MRRSHLTVESMMFRSQLNKKYLQQFTLRRFSTKDFGLPNLTPTSQQQLPSRSRLVRHIAQWQKPENYDVNYPGPLAPEQVYQYYTDGYLILDNIIPQSLIDGCKDDINGLVDQLAHKLYANNLIKNKHENAGFYQRLSLLEEEFPGASVLLHKFGKLNTKDTKSIIDTWSFDGLTSVAEQLLQLDPSLKAKYKNSKNGTINMKGKSNYSYSYSYNKDCGLAAHPVWNLRCKIPNNEESTVPWHQDTAYVDSKAWGTHQLTAWVPLLNATIETGCMQLIKGGHLNGNVATHTSCSGNTWYVDLAEDVLRCEIIQDKPYLRYLKKNPNSNTNENEIDLNDYITTCEVAEGSVLLLNNVIPHRSLNNFSDKIRWSIDLRWQNYNESSGFDHVKDLLLIKSYDKQFNQIYPNYKPDWDHWDKVNRITAFDGDTSTQQSSNDDDDDESDNQQSKQNENDSTSTGAGQTIGELDPIIVGPWMEAWEVVHQSKHSKAYFSAKM